MTCDVKSDRPDAELARMAARGDAAAFEEIHGRYRRYVYSVGLRMTGNEADAEDLTQDSFVSVLRGVGGFRGESSFATWLYRLVVNQAKMHFRRRRSRPEEQAGDGEMLERAWDAKGRADSRQLIDRLAIEKAIGRLPRGYRAAFILYDVEGHDHEEVARLMGWKAGTSKSQLHRARVGLREMLSSQAPAFHV